MVLTKTRKTYKGLLEEQNNKKDKQKELAIIMFYSEKL